MVKYSKLAINSQKMPIFEKCLFYSMHLDNTRLKSPKTLFMHNLKSNYAPKTHFLGLSPNMGMDPGRAPPGSGKGAP